MLMDDKEVLRSGTLQIFNPDDAPVRRRRSTVDALRRKMRPFLQLLEGATPRNPFEVDMMSTGGDGRQPLMWE